MDSTNGMLVWPTQWLAQVDAQSPSSQLMLESRTGHTLRGQVDLRITKNSLRWVHPDKACVHQTDKWHTHSLENTEWYVWEKTAKLLSENMEMRPRMWKYVTNRFWIQTQWTPRSVFFQGTLPCPQDHGSLPMGKKCIQILFQILL